MIRYVSLFSGAGGWDLGCDAAGWECVAQVEWDPWCQRVLERHWPDVPRWGDIRDVSVVRQVQSDRQLGSDRVHAGYDNGRRERDRVLPSADVICFGSPCTDLSVAGQRAGLDGDASGLFHEAIRIIREMRHATGFQLPRAVCWENVAGAFSSNSGRDFARVLDELGALGAVGVEWRLVDGLAFGPPQRRTRVFVVAQFDSEARGGRPVFAERPGVPRHPRAGRTAGTVVAPLLAGGDGRGYRIGAEEAAGGHLIANGGGKPGSGYAAVAIPLDLRNAARSTGTGAGTQGTGIGNPGDPAGTLTGGSLARPAVAHPVARRGREDGAEWEVGDEGVYNALRAGDGGSSRQNAVATEMFVRRLTPRECERLMGWPDDHTRWTADGTDIADSHRYRMCGNGVMAPMGEWVARRITEALENTNAEAA